MSLKIKYLYQTNKIWGILYNIKLLFLLLFLPVYLFAQEEENTENRWKLFIHGGVENSNILLEGKPVGNSITFLNIGPEAEFRFTKKIRVDAELLFSQRGTAFTKPFFKQKISYFDLPLRFKYRILGVIDLFAGYQASLAFDSHLIYSEDLDPKSITATYIRNIRSYQDMFLGGLAVPVSNDVTISVTYLRGVTQISPSGHTMQSFRFGLSYNLSGKGIGPGSKTTAPVSEKERTAMENIKRLKNGVLFVRLKSGRNQVEAMMNRGETARAQEIRKEYEQRNKAVMQAFKEKYNFSPVYFFFDYNTEKVTGGDFEQVFVDETFNYVPAPRVEYSNFFIAEVGDIWFESFKANFDGLAIMDNQLQQLEDPFPYYVRSFENLEALGLDKEYETLIEKFNTRLHRFYSK